MRACMRALREGRILGIFPEGTRHHKGLMDQLEGGTGVAGPCVQRAPGSGIF